jgi:hypothetical protein
MNFRVKRIINPQNEHGCWLLFLGSKFHGHSGNRFKAKKNVRKNEKNHCWWVGEKPKVGSMVRF